MKTLKLKSFIVAGMIAMGGMMLNSGSAFANEPGSSTINEKYQKDNALIREDIAAVHMQKANIKELKSRLQKDRAAGLTEAVIIDKRDLCKARADLRKSKVYLSADKTNLTRDHRLAIRNHRDEVKKYQASLSKYKSKLNKDIANGNEEGITYDAKKIVNYQNMIQYENTMANREREHLSSDLAAIDKELDNLNIQRATVTSASSETAYTRTNGKYYK